MKLYDTTEWSFDRISRYGEQITAHFRKLVARFPDDVSLEGLSQSVMSGEQRLWVLLTDDEETVKAIGLTEIRINPMTGHKSVVFTNAAGEMAEMMPFMTDIEAYGRSVGAHDVRPNGRLGWKKPLEKLGFELVTCFYRKEI